ncbi:MAG: hypothetical protein ACK6A9_19215 [Dolichospermum sp.]|jgi:hypothetical protein|uniref:Uncharacterized protein n=1 Tax=Dolichospermum circinale CS-537/01 TaxID=3021739 RepID=A0ABT5A0C2_9CYAN|nr:hypothetical protein [Dolichospermum circinale]MDB9485345.1 hypothetical protein [Dolichospermum circinale CS-537/01]
MVKKSAFLTHTLKTSPVDFEPLNGGSTTEGYSKQQWTNESAGEF